MRAWLLGFLLLLSPMLSLAQGSRYQAYALDQSGRPLGNLQVRVCVSPAISTPCANPALLFTDAALGTSAPNPVTTDSVGNFAFYTTPGFYHLQYFQPGATTSIYEEDIQVSLTTPTGSVNATYVDASIGYKVAGTYGTNGQCLTSTGVASIWGSCGGGGGSGTVTSVSCGGLGPLFSCSVGTPTTTPSIAFTLSNAAANTVYGNNTGGLAPPGFQSLVLAQLPSAGAHTIATTSPLGGGGSVALGGTLTLTCTGCLTSVTAHNLLSATHGDTTASAAVRGGGIFAVGISPTWTQVAHSSATGGYFKWNGTDIVASTLAAAGTGSPTACTNQAVTAFTLNADAAPTSTCTTITSAFTSGSFPATAHAILSATHSDSTVGTVARGDLITGQGASPTWTRLAKGTANQLLAMDATGTDIIWATASGTGTVTHTAGALTLNQLVFGNGAADIAVGDLTGDVTTSGAKATTIAAGAVTHAKLAADGKNWLFLGSATGAATTVGPIIWTATCREEVFHYIIKGYNGGTPIGRFLTGVASISTTALTNGSNLSQNFAAPTSAPSIPGIPLATTTSNIPREGWIYVYGASGDLKSINIQGQNGSLAVASPPSIFIAAGAFSDLGTNLPLLRAQITVYDTLLTTTPSAQAFNTGTLLEGWCRNGD